MLNSFHWNRATSQAAQTPYFLADSASLHSFITFLLLFPSSLRQIIFDNNTLKKKIQADPTHHHVFSVTATLWGRTCSHGVSFPAGSRAILLLGSSPRPALPQALELPSSSRTCSGAPPQPSVHGKGQLLKALKWWRNFENSSPGPQMWQTCGFLCICSIANLTRNRKLQQSHKEVCSDEVSWPFSDTEEIALLNRVLLVEEASTGVNRCHYL